MNRKREYGKPYLRQGHIYTISGHELCVYTHHAGCETAQWVSKNNCRSGVMREDEEDGFQYNNNFTGKHTCYKGTFILQDDFEFRDPEGSTKTAKKVWMRRIKRWWFDPLKFVSSIRNIVPRSHFLRPRSVMMGTLKVKALKDIENNGWMEW